MIKSWGVLTDMDKELFKAIVEVPRGAVLEGEYEFLSEAKINMLWRDLSEWEIATAREILDLAAARHN